MYRKVAWELFKIKFVIQPAGIQNLDIFLARLLKKLRRKDSPFIHKGVAVFDGLRHTAKPVRRQASFNSINLTSPLQGDAQESRFNWKYR